MSARHSSPPGSPWPERDAELMELWLWRGPEGEAHSTVEIGRRMKLSKHALVGRAHRLGLPGRESPIRRSERPVSPKGPARSVGAHTLPPLPSQRA
jgi:hypothetical protein